MAINKTFGRVGIGVVVREERGWVVAARSRTQLGALEPKTGKLLHHTTRFIFVETSAYNIFS